MLIIHHQTHLFTCSHNAAFDALQTAITLGIYVALQHLRRKRYRNKIKNWVKNEGKEKGKRRKMKHSTVPLKPLSVNKILLLQFLLKCTPKKIFIHKLFIWLFHFSLLHTIVMI